MKPPAPTIVRKGAVVRISGRPEDNSVSALALAFLDLRFADGHLERWLGSGTIADKSTAAEQLADVVAWAKESADEHALTVYGELASMDAGVVGWPSAFACFAG